MTESTNGGERVGFTGTRHGMTTHQRPVVAELIRGCDWLHHGDCDGSDREAHYIATALGIKTAAHPPSNLKLRAQCGATFIHQPKGYLQRDRDIVNATVRMIATPHGMEEEERSGTWYTIRYAQSVGKPVMIVFPDGSIRNV